MLGSENLGVMGIAVELFIGSSPERLGFVVPRKWKSESLDVTYYGYLASYFSILCGEDGCFNYDGTSYSVVDNDYGILIKRVDEDVYILVESIEDSSRHITKTYTFSEFSMLNPVDLYGISKRMIRAIQKES